MSKTKQTKKSAQKPATELSETALDKTAGGSFSWGMQTAMGDGSVRTGTPQPGALLPAVQKTQN